MALNLFETYSLLMAVQQLTPVSTFLRDRYFPTNDTTDIFSTENVLVEYRDGSKKIAPFVAPRKGGVTILRNGYEMKQFKPPYIAPKRMITIDELNKRGFGEALLSNLTPEQRQNALLMKDADELGELISRREEAMAAETMLTNGCIMKHIADDASKEDEQEIRFYSEDTNPATYTADTKWDATGAKILDDIDGMRLMLSSKGLGATDLICSPDVADTIINDETIQKLLDIRNYNVGEVAPVALPNGVSLICRLNIKGKIITVYSYEETYTSDAGVDTLFIPSGKCILTAPGAGRTLYGAVSQIEQGGSDLITYAGRRVPKFLSDPKTNTRELYLSSRPLLIPNNKNPFIVADVLTA